MPIDLPSSAYNAGDPGSIPGSGRSPGEGNGNALQYSTWKVPLMEEPGNLQSMGSQRVGQTEQLHFLSFFPLLMFSLSFLAFPSWPLVGP